MRLSPFLAAPLLLFLWGSPLLAFAEVAPASSGCDCYCQSSAGAVKTRNVSDAIACETTCKAKNERVAICAKNAGQVPANSPRCFDDAKSCEATCAGPPIPNRPPSGFLFDQSFQPPECPPTFRYCYCTGASYPLAIHIGSTASVKDVGDYVNTVYKYLLGFAVTLAIVMMMIGGLKYVLSAGGANAQEAKEEIKNAAIGLVLLFGAALMLQTVNPRLLSLQPPRLPAIKRIELIGNGKDCKTLADKGFIIKGYSESGISGAPYAERACGQKSEVLKDPKDSPVVEGSICVHKGCSDSKASCFVSQEGGKCLSCGDIVPGNDLGVSPSGSVCNQLTPKASNPNDKLFCFWTRDPYALFGLNWKTAKTELAALLGSAVGGIGGSFLGPLGTVAGAAVGSTVSGALEFQNGTCALLEVDCPNMSQTCEAYNDLVITNKIANSSKLKNLSPSWGQQDMKTICESDPCKMAKNSGPCLFISHDNTCITTIRGQGSAGDSCHQGRECNSNRCVRNRCIPSAGIPDGDTCSANSDCQSEVCNTAFEPDICVARASLDADKQCDQDAACKSNNCGPYILAGIPVPGHDDICYP